MDRVYNRNEVARDLANRYGIASEFVRVEALSRVLGLQPSTIYNQMRCGRFCMPHRKLCSIPVVRFDDLVDWYVDDARRGAENGESVGERPVDEVAREVDPFDEVRAKQAARRSAQALITEQIVASAMLGIRSRRP